MKPSEILLATFPFAPTNGQKAVFSLLDDFLSNARKEKQVFILKGYAGTGKTTAVGRIVDMLPTLDLKYVMLAPTGRAAKVMAGYSGKRAYTIHKHIYTREGEDAGEDLRFVLKNNLASKTVYIVDEASMISDDAGYNSPGLLQDLFKFVFAKKSNRLLLIGDSAQLPPVKQAFSPALEAESLQLKYDCKVSEFELTEVLRQQAKSGILENATLIRESIRKKNAEVKLIVKGYPDVYRMGGERLEEGVNYAYQKYGQKNTMIITRSNKTATIYNQYIRTRIIS